MATCCPNHPVGGANPFPVSWSEWCEEAMDPGCCDDDQGRELPMLCTLLRDEFGVDGYADDWYQLWCFRRCQGHCARMIC